MKKTIFLFICLAGLFVFSHIETFACGCVGDPNQTFEHKIKWNLKKSKAVFTGKVIEITRNSENYGFTTKLKVEKSWKDFRPEEIIIVGDGSSCEYHFTIGKEYLVYAYEWENKLQTDSCLGNKEISKATEELKILGKGKRPLKSKL